MTFAQWDRAADGVAGLLAGPASTRGSVVCLLLPSSIDYMVCYAAAARLGAVTSGINLRLGDRRGPLHPRAHPPGGHRGRGRGAGPTWVRPAWCSSGRRCGRRMDGPAPDHLARPADRSDPVAVVWTSGTTGLPKGAVFDHAGLAAVADGTDVLSEPGDRRLSPLPFAHVGSMTRPWDEIANGVTTVITPTPWRAGGRHPDHGRGADHRGPGRADPVGPGAGPPRPRRGRPVRRCGSPAPGRPGCPPELVAAMRERLGVPVVVRYTSTEASLGHRHRSRRPRRGGGHHGRPPGARGVELAIVDDDGRRCRPGRSDGSGCAPGR